MLLSPALLLEYEAICRLPEHHGAAGLTLQEVDAFLDVLVKLSEPVATYFRWRPQLSDPGDELVLEAAVNGRAAALVTFNHRDYRLIPARFGIELLYPGQALRRLAT